MYEGYGLPLIEAFSHGKAVLSPLLEIVAPRGSAIATACGADELFGL